MWAANLKDMTREIVAYTDGGSRGNPGPAAIGIILVAEGRTLLEHKERIGKATNNQAEYHALIKALELAAGRAPVLRCTLDSELVARQATGKYRVKDRVLQGLFATLREKEKTFEKVSYSHAPRSHPVLRRADWLVNEALDEG